MRERPTAPRYSISIEWDSILASVASTSRPGAIPPASTRVHKVTDDMVADAPDILTASKQLHKFTRDSVIVAHNAPFDMSFLRRHGKTAGLSWDNPIIDTVLLSAVLFGRMQL